MSLLVPVRLRPLAFMLAANALIMPTAAPASATATGPPAATPPAETLPANAPASVVDVLPLISNLPEPLIDYLRLGVDMADRMTLPVEIGKGGPYPFIIDTGSHRSIVATELARDLDLAELPPVEIVSMAGRETVASVRLHEMRYGSQVVNDLPALSIAHDTLGSAGLIGLDGLKDKRLTLDFKKRQMLIGKSGPIGKAPFDYNTIVVEARSKYGQLILINSRLDGKRVNVILDTGAEISVGNMALFNSLKLKKLVIAPRKVEIRSVTGLPVEALYTVVRKLQINSITLNNVPMVFLDAAPFEVLDLADKPSMLLGMKMLRMFDRWRSISAIAMSTSRSRRGRPREEPSEQLVVAL